MVLQDVLLVTWVKRVVRLSMPALADKRGRGRPVFNPDRMFLHAAHFHCLGHASNGQ
jgi:hypothetical protein